MANTQHLTMNVCFHVQAFSARPPHPKSPAVLSNCSRPGRRLVVAAGSNGVYTVTLVLPSGHEAVFRAGTSKSIYDIASYAGVHLPASCR